MVSGTRGYFVYLSEFKAERLLQVVITDKRLTPRQKARHARLQTRDYAPTTVILYPGLRIGKTVRSGWTT